MIKEKLKKTILNKPLLWVNDKRLYLKEVTELAIYKRSKYSKQMKKWKGIENGKCFILGNGPSLSIDDLEVLHEHNIPCFAANRIYSLYSKTVWRPKFYACQDNRVMEQIYEDLPYAINESKVSFISLNNYKHKKELLNEKKCQFYFIRHKRNGKEIDFSNDISQGIFEGMTIVYSMAQIAIYLGYTEIYLLGVDHNFVPASGKSNDEKNHFKGIKKIDDSNLYPPNYVMMNRAFKYLKKYSEQNGISVYNATRGGMLEIYNRVNFDELFK